MYKLNILQGHQFFDFQAPANFFAKKNQFLNTNEIKPKRKDSFGKIIRAISLPKSFWFRDYDACKQQVGDATDKKVRNYEVACNPIYYKRKNISESLTNYRNRACTPHPCKKWKKYRNLNVVRKSPTKLGYEGGRKNFLDSLCLVVPTQSISFSRSNRSSFVSPTQSIMLTNSIKKIPEHRPQYRKPQLMRLSRLRSNRTDEKGNENSQTLNQPLMDISCSQSHYNNSDSNEKINYCSAITQKNKFINDCYRLYGLDSSQQIPKNKLAVVETPKLISSQETAQTKLYNNINKLGSYTHREKPTLIYQQHKLLDLIKKQQTYKQVSTSPKTNPANSIEKDNRILNTYFPTIQNIQVRKKILYTDTF